MARSKQQLKQRAAARRTARREARAVASMVVCEKCSTLQQYNPHTACRGPADWGCDSESCITLEAWEEAS